MILQAKVSDTYCREMADLRAAGFGRAACAQHSPPVAVFLLSIPTFWRRRERERMIKTTNFRRVTEFSDISFLFVRVSFHIREQNYQSCFCENERGRQRVCSVCPPSFSVSPCLPDLTRNILFFWQSVEPSQGTPNQVPFQLTVYFLPSWQCDL